LNLRWLNDFSGFFGAILMFIFIGFLYHCYKHQNDDEYKQELRSFIKFCNDFYSNKTDESTFILSKVAIKFGLKNNIFFEPFKSKFKSALRENSFIDNIELDLKRV